MKKLFFVMLAIVMFATSVYATEPAATCTIYAPDGVAATIYKSELELYKSLGWYETREDVIRTVYDENGQEAVIYLAYLASYIDNGWFENKGDAYITVYNCNGEEISILKSKLGEYNKIGWFENKDDVVKTLYAPDGREVTVFKSEVGLYTALGWYETREDVTQTLYAPDGREITVYKNEVSLYTALGWYENKEDVTQTIYAPNGTEIIVFKTEVSLYTALGWYENKAEVTTKLAHPDGRKTTVYNTEVQKYKDEGWSVIQNDIIDPNKPMIALTFDDGPSQAYTTRVLKALENYNARATFFVVGNLAENNAPLLTNMKQLNCQIGNHSYSHPELTTLSTSNISWQVNQTSQIIKNATGSSPTLLRPPYGSYNNTTLNTVGMPFILWSIDTRDWESRNADSVTNIALNNAKDGDIILMHDIYESTATAAERIIPALINRGFQLVTVDELAYYKGITLTSGKAYSSIR